jgi:heat shock protein HslJ
MWCVLMSLLLGACAGLLSVPAPPLLGTTWQVVEFQGEPFTAPAGQVFTLRLERDGQMKVYAGCAPRTGRYQLKAERNGSGILRVGPFDLLESLCASEIAVLERKVIHAMEGGSRYMRPNAQELSLHNPIGITLIRFRAEP